MATKEEQREYQRKWIAKRRAEWFEGQSCIDCGSSEQLELDHIDASKKVTNRIWSWSADRRAEELAKCVVRCKPCHVRKTRDCEEHVTGEKNGSAKISLNDAVAIFESTGSGYDVAAQYGIGPSQVYRIRRGQMWQREIEAELARRRTVPAGGE